MRLEHGISLATTAIYSEHDQISKSSTLRHRNQSQKISYNKYYEKWGTIDKIKHKQSMLQPRIRPTWIMTSFFSYSARIEQAGLD